MTIGGHTYRTTVARMGGRFLIPLSAENRTGPAWPPAIRSTSTSAWTAGRARWRCPLTSRRRSRRTRTARATFDGLSYTHRKEWVRWIEEAKKPETRATRLAKTVESLREGKRAR